MGHIARWGNIRVACATDLDAVLQCDHLAAARGTYLSASIDSGHCWVALESQRVAGFVIVERSFFGYEFVSLLVVHPELRRTGVARALLHNAIANCSTAKLFTSTNQSNVPAQALYLSVGFEPSGVIHNLDVGDPELIYCLHITTRIETITGPDGPTV